MDIKTCKKCGAKKPLSHFYKHPKAADGRAGVCKECAKASSRENRRKNIEHYRAYDAKRFKDDPRVKARHLRYQATEAGKAAMNRARKRWNENNSEKRAAHILLGNRIRDGKVVKPDHCQECGATGRIHGHHEDYAKPLEVEWLCPQCHTNRHKDDKNEVS